MAGSSVHQWLAQHPARTWAGLAAGLAVAATTVAGCVSPAVLKDTIAKLEASHKRTLQVAREFEEFKTHTTEEMIALKREQSRLAKELVAARVAVGDTQTDLESSQYHLDSERTIRQEAESKLQQLEADRKSLATRLADLEARLEHTHDKLGQAWEARGRALARVELLEQEREKLVAQLVTAQNKEQQLERLGEDTRRERDLLLLQVKELRESLSLVQLRLTQVEQEKKRARGALRKATNRARMLEAALSAEQENWKSLQKALTKVRQNAEPAVQ